MKASSTGASRISTAMRRDVNATDRECFQSSPRAIPYPASSRSSRRAVWLEIARLLMAEKPRSTIASVTVVTWRAFP